METITEVVRAFLAPGYGSGSGSGDGSGSGWGSGSGYGSGDGSGDGDGCGSGDGDGVKSYNREPVYMVDGVQTIIRIVRHGVARGAILNSDLSTTPCYVVRSGDTYAHGETLRKAMDALTDKILDDAPEEERIAAFWRKHNRTDRYPGRDLWTWHHRLTGSCEMGRDQFCRDRGIDIDGSTWTVAEFIDLCRDSYGGAVIRKLDWRNK